MWRVCHIEQLLLPNLISPFTENKVQLLSHVQLFRPHGHVSLPCPSLSPRVGLNSWPLSQWCYITISFSAILFSFCLRSFPASESFSNESVFRIRWPRYWSFSFSISPSHEYSGLISFRIDWFDLLAIQGTLNKSSPALQIPIRGVEFPTQCTKTRLNGYRCAVLFICFFSNGELSQ